MPWHPTDIAFFDIVDDGTEDPVVTAKIETPAGVMELMAEAEDQGRTLYLRGLHVQGLHPNAIGHANLRVIAEVVMERMDYDAVEIEGAIRTTGANPGRRPRSIRFIRRARAAPGS